MSEILFRSQKNLMARHDSSGSTLMQGPHNNYYSVLHKSEHVVNHNLGSPKMYIVFYEPFQDGRLFPGINSQNDVLHDPPTDFSSSTTAPLCFTEMFDNKLVITLSYNADLSTEEYQVYWNIYEDYDLDT